MNLAERHYEPFNQDDAEEERKNFLSVLAAFRFYRYENSFFWVALQSIHCTFNRIFAYHLCRDIVLDSIFVHELHALNHRFNVPTIFSLAWKKCEITERLTFRILFHMTNSNLNNVLLLVALMDDVVIHIRCHWNEFGGWWHHDDDDSNEFCIFRTYSMARVDKTEAYLNTLPAAHQDMLVKYRDNLHRIRYCIDENFQIIRKLIEDVGNLFENANNQTVLPNPYQNGYDEGRVRTQDLDKV